MTKQEFLDGLKRALSASGSQRLIDENISYYSRYIDDEIAKGRSKEDVMEELGDPRLIARSIMDAANISTDFPKSQYDNRANNQSNDDTSTSQSHKNRLFFIIPIIAIIAIMICIIWIIAGIFTILSPILMPILIICLILWLMRILRR